MVDSASIPPALASITRKWNYVNLLINQRALQDRINSCKNSLIAELFFLVVISIWSSQN